MERVDQLLQENRVSLTLRILQLGLGLLFVYASLDKIWQPGAFAEAISNYRILPLSLLHGSAITLAWLELLIGLALIIGRYVRSANLITGILLVIFIAAILSAMARGLDFNCGCFDLDAEASNLGISKILENTGLLLIVAMIEIRERRSWKPIAR